MTLRFHLAAAFVLAVPAMGQTVEELVQRALAQNDGILAGQSQVAAARGGVTSSICRAGRASGAASAPAQTAGRCGVGSVGGWYSGCGDEMSYPNQSNFQSGEPMAAWWSAPTKRFMS